MKDKIYFVERMWLPLEEQRGSTSSHLVEVYNWALSELQKQRRVTIYAISGEANPDTWNSPELKEKIFTFLEKGGKQEHIVGPVISVKEGKHSIIEAYKENPKNMELYISITRLPYHWILAESLKSEDIRFWGDIHFLMRGETYHKPLAERRWAYKLKIDSEDLRLNGSNDYELIDKMGVWNEKKKDFEIIKGMGQKVDEGFLLEDYCIEVEALHRIVESAGEDFDFLNKEEILEYAKKKEL